ncbi:VapE domain-containing protein [uncultured Parabacteroides sp.]|uniref:VapE domain-containing protein n=1 Tax=uncultured Parabacteroides sp. TaxID=512312 RepID=UPI00261CF9A5|nr:VapE domain-containing protein [uncultured Parabacteroides sp.]
MDFKPLLVTLGRLCFAAGVEEEDCVKWTMLYLGNLISEVEIRETLRQSYRLASDSDFGCTSLYKPEQIQSLKMEEFMNLHYDFRYNLMSGGPEYREKNTFCFNLLPPDLNKYYTDSIDFSKKRDTELYLSRFGLINMDEFDQVSARHQGFLKHLLQKPVVNVYKPYATQVESVKRYASFIAASNHADLLGDPSGSHRFICIEVKGLIDNDQPIDYLQLYAQAVAALNNNERYWLTHEEEVLRMQANEAFQQRPLFEDLFFQYYRPASHKEEGLKISAREIYLSLQKKSGVKLPMSNVSVFSRFLKKIGLMTQLASRGRLYLVVEK